jgi:hypothetical protein
MAGRLLAPRPAGPNPKPRPVPMRGRTPGLSPPLGFKLLPPTEPSQEGQGYTNAPPATPEIIPWSPAPAGASPFATAPSGTSDTWICWREVTSKASNKKSGFGTPLPSDCETLSGAGHAGSGGEAQIPQGLAAGAHRAHFRVGSPPGRSRGVAVQDPVKQELFWVWPPTPA